MNVPQDERLLEYIKQAPIFANFSLPDLARLIPYRQEHSYSAGEKLFQKEEKACTLYLIIEGEVQITSDRCSMSGVTEGFLGEESVIGQPVYFYQAIASKTTKLLTLDGMEVNCWLIILTPNRDFSFSLLRLGIKDKKISKVAQNNNKKAEKAEFKDFVGWLLSCLIPVGLYYLPWFAEIQPNTRIFVSIFAATILMWIFKLVPDYIAGLLPILVVLVLGITPSSVILGGFQSLSFFMALSIFVLSAIVV